MERQDVAGDLEGPVLVGRTQVVACHGIAAIRLFQNSDPGQQVESPGVRSQRAALRSVLIWPIRVATRLLSVFPRQMI